MDTVCMDDYRRAHDGFDRVLTAVPAGQVEAPSACDGWTVRDVVGHMIWGQELVRHLAAGQEYMSRTGAPGAETPGRLADGDPLALWREAREAADAALTEKALALPAPPRFRTEHPEATLGHFMNVLVIEALVHAWDVGRPLGIEVDLDRDLVAASFAIADEIVMRVPGMFGPALTPPPDADEQTRWLAFLGRTV